MTQFVKHSTRKLAHCSLQWDVWLQLNNLIGDSTIDNHWNDHIEISVHHYCELLLQRRGIVSHGPRISPLSSVPFIAWTMHLCAAPFADALWAFPAVHRRAPHTPSLSAQNALLSSLRKWPLFVEDCRGRYNIRTGRIDIACCSAPLFYDIASHNIVCHSRRNY